MKRFYKFFLAVVLFVVTVTLASCGSKSGVKATLEATTVTKDSIKLTAYFDAYDAIKNEGAQAFIECYTIEGEEEKYKSKNVLSFGGNYTDTTTEFTSLSVATEYKFILKVTYQDNDEEIATLKESTSKKGSTSDTAIIINTKEDLLKMKEDQGAYYELGADLDLSKDGKATDFEPLFSESKPFKGSFDGKGHKISGLKLKTTSYIGLFGYVSGTEDKKVTISNLTIENVSVDVTRTTCYLGTLAGYTNNTIISNVTASNVDFKLSCNLGAKVWASALVGKAINTSFDGVTLTDAKLNMPKVRIEARVGLLAAQVEGLVANELVKDVNVTGSITVNANYQNSEDDQAFLYIGGLIGENDSQSPIVNANVTADILLTKETSTASYTYFDLAVGGFIGFVNGSLDVTNSTANGDITVYAGQAPTGETEEEKTEALNKVKDTVLTDKKAYIAGFVGAMTQKIVKISDSKYNLKENGITVYAKASEAKDSDDNLKGAIYLSSRVAYSVKENAASYLTLTVKENKITTSLDETKSNVTIVD